MELFFISGISGSGKSTFADELAKKLGWTHVNSTDDIRNVVRRYSNNPIIKTSSVKDHECEEIKNEEYKSSLKKFAPKDETNNPEIKGIIAQAEVMREGIKGFFKRFVMENKNLILEGTNLIPGFYTIPDDVKFTHIVLTVPNKEVYIERVTGQGDERSGYKIAEVDRLFAYQDYLVSTAEKYNSTVLDPKEKVKIFENNNIDLIVKEILEERKSFQDLGQGGQT